jgi:DNA-binding LytR/AlgR family response regulator
MKVNRSLGCVILDDEPLAARLIADYVDKTPGLTLLETFTSSILALDYLQQNPVDVLYLDVQMPDLNGIQLMKVLRGKIKVVLTTAYPEYAVDGFEYNATDYLLKPISFERFLVSVQKILQEPIPIVPLEKEEDFIFIKSGYRTHKIRFDEISYLQGFRDYVAVHVNGKKMLTQQGMNSFETVLPKSKFVRIHRSYIIAVEKIEYLEKRRVYIGGIPLPVSETYKSGLDSLTGEV